MTTFTNITVDRTKAVVQSWAPERPDLSSEFWVGSLTFRNSTGGDRTPGQFRTMRKVYIPYWTKPRFGTIVEVNPDYTFWSKASKKARKRMKRPPKTIRRKTEVSRPVLKYRSKWERDDRVVSDTDHTYTAVRYTKASASELLTRRFITSWQHWYHSIKALSNLPGVTDPWNSNDSIALLGNLREKIAGSSFNAAVSLGESPRALKMIAESATKIFTAYKAVKRGDPFGAARALTGKQPPRHVSRKLKTNREAAASNWLELQYGWKPLVQDAYDAAVFTDHQLRRPASQTYKATRYANGVKSFKSEVPYNSGLAWLQVNATSRRSIVARLTSVDNVRLAGLLDPAPLAWELLPWSFVVDWFIPIGNYLSARGLASAITGTFVTTHVFKLEDRREKARIASSHSLFSAHNGSTDRLKWTQMSRTISTSLSIPKPEFKPLSKVASWAHAANAVALLVNHKR